jgi:hypothetical protein
VSKAEGLLREEIALLHRKAAEERRQALRTLGAVVLAAGRIVKVRPSHQEDLTSYNLVTEREHDTMSQVFRMERKARDVPIVYGEPS